MNQENKAYNDDEIDLRELWQTLVKSKVLIVALTCCVTLGGVVYAWVKTPIYEAKAVLEIGSYTNTNTNTNTNWVELPSTLLKRIEISYILNKDTTKSAWLDKITLAKGTPNLLEMSVFGLSQESVASHIKSIETSIREKHEQLMDAYVDSIQEKMDNLKAQKEELLIDKERLVKELDKKSDKIEQIIQKNPAVAAVYSIELNSYTGELADIKNRIFSIHNQLNDLNLSISPKNLKMTEIIDKINVSDAPIQPKKSLIVAVTFVTGLILSIFLVFFLEFIGKKDDE